jgi:hypothetical protein
MVLPRSFHRSIAVVFFGIAGVAPLAAQSTGVTVDYIVLVDVSGSMVGLPAGQGHYNIFPRVQEAVSSFLSELEPGARVVIAPFAGGLRPSRRFDIQTRSDIEAAQQFVRSLQATGSNTYVYGAIRDLFSRYSLMRAADSTRVAALLVFTDGEDNGPEGLTMQQVVDSFALKRQENDFIYYATLGAALSATDSAALATEFSRYDRNETGNVHPIRVVEPQLSLLDFGNLRRQPNAEQSEPFAVRGAGPLPDGARLTARAEFPQLAEHGGAYLRIEPAEFPPGDEVKLGAQLRNGGHLPEQEAYYGVIHFESTHPQLLVIPGRIRARFAYLPRAAARLLLPLGKRKLRGDLDPFGAAGGKDSERQVLRLALDSVAERRGGTFGVRVRQDPGNPTVLPPTAFRVNGQPGVLHQANAARGNLEFALEVDSGAVEPGRYRGTLLVADGSVEFDGPREVPWEVEVRRRPLPKSVWAGIVLLALAVVTGGAVLFRHLRTPPKLVGRLTVRTTERYGHEIPLSGKREVAVGSGTGELGDANGRIRIVSEGTRRKYRTRVHVDEGSARLHRQGEIHDVSIASESLQDGDTVALPPYRIEYNRY